jgi:hypothetical protein
MANEIPVSSNALAVTMDRHPSYITAMKSAGYVFTHGTRTLLSDALRWLAEHPDFRTTGYYREHRARPDGAQGAPGFVKDWKRSTRAKQCRRPVEKRLRYVSQEQARDKVLRGQALNLKELALVTGFSYSAVRSWSLPVLSGKIFYDDFVLWRRRQSGLEPPLASAGKTTLSPADTQEIPSHKSEIRHR